MLSQRRLCPAAGLWPWAAPMRGAEHSAASTHTQPGPWHPVIRGTLGALLHMAEEHFHFHEESEGDVV